MLFLKSLKIMRLLLKQFFQNALSLDTQLPINSTQEEEDYYFILLNPSTATEKVYDPTLLRCKKRAIYSCVNQFRVCNLFAYRATKPKELQKVSDPIGPYNNEILKKV